MQKYKMDIMALSLALAGSTGISLYWEMSFFSASASSILLLLLTALLFMLWKKLPREAMSVRGRLFWYVFSLLFSGVLFVGKALDLDLSVGFPAAVKAVLLSIGVFPAVCAAVGALDRFSRRTPPTLQPAGQKLTLICFGAVTFCWLLGYLAAFPGIYAVDAMTWYREFNDPAFPVSSQWSPVYAGLFYLFVHTGWQLVGNYECGMAVFSALQTGFILTVVLWILRYVRQEAGDAACIGSTLFFALIPLHVVMSVQSIQDAPFMACFAMLLLHLLRMIREPEQYWSRKRNWLGFIAWGLAGCILRNNAFYGLICFAPFIFFYPRPRRKKLFACLGTVLLLATLYKGPVLKLFGVQNGSALRECLSLPLQQMACAYIQFPEEVGKREKEELTAYVPDEALQDYTSIPSISDTVKSALNVDAVQKAPQAFLGLYVRIGLQAPAAYLKAAYLQDLGLFFLDKSYPDGRTWHPYLNYASYNLHNDAFITIQRQSLFPAYNRLLGNLFGYTENGYGGDVTTQFSSVPVLGVLCRVSTYFWLLLFLICYGLYRRWKEPYLLLGLCAGFTMTIIASPVIMYRYYAPVVFSAPLLVLLLFPTQIAQKANRLPEGAHLSETARSPKIEPI